MQQDSHNTDVIANINYFPATGIPIPKSEWKVKYLDDKDEYTRPMLIRDVRKANKTFDLDVNGFTFVTLPQKQRVDRHSSEEDVKREYYPELEEVVKKLTNASTVHIFNHVIRAHTSPSAKGIQDALGRWQDIPSGHPHVDYAGSASALSGTLTELSLPPHINNLFTTSTRYAFLNCWRPLKTVRRDPLAVCDADTVPESDYQVRLREFSRTGNRSENYVISCGALEKQEREEEGGGMEEGIGKGHEWWYMSGMQPWEMVVFKGLDSKREERGWRCPHTAFRVEGSEGEEARESIEARVVAFWE
ncbi:uncharacterized protein J4E84_002097 [Alternaria hordeiaustralica]|uniref:uncharacterized protein n=1 Tax=Alternaria hordeiaustralica TaxID=1187925 RepID=UPI0020C43885|nr:uncharacterized protein J4E84_002097 [Alternaria hordeiaustralica]KAI4695470.1 hypothetical protein J4E84_002097 [Alternaria hordeiaustralica]